MCTEGIVGRGRGVRERERERERGERERERERETRICSTNHILPYTYTYLPTYQTLPLSPPYSTHNSIPSVCDNM